ncbi:phospho-n-acetylmuramoyl-pentapeptide-transferase, putative [Heliomicrobium modesticaldum Ice1]|uniref:Phospho-N-acetylmuramoyl-pentapeptide-transferase n=1 Tax=Heliobacterium modesticaldum (strain ATCC 51547 / Ice1) TaxID=498761 RepID=MRAY_HELMI|nr:phospho-N-acetylmuramoyl-pentapeptide-transferase [Heliomicrobium modesticaldum]B0TGB7.1 RecName: Full=Phospho-N-acetylmuramoyl-pentapeptide-transferase; AltName: Full=UDP-MurNAc-pentapeptide phosphotransferase [Heliomicrobium modesticaldum Ice1]ABZ84613.1 phospho-n-acetylmuramoyl-pentapeptide-transferase, putative [Heliomicrobium modesticaldum Ice1]
MQKMVWAFIVASAVGLLIGPWLIPYLRRLKFGQSIREEGPKGHQRKAGTPTMGGLLFLIAVPMAVLVTVGFTPQSGVLLLGLLGFGLIGFLDDYIKVVKKRNLGLRAWQKFTGQLILSLILIYGVVYGIDRGTSLYLPGFEVWWDAGALYYPLALLLIVGTTNAVNLADGLDGLAAGMTFWVALAFAAIASAGTSDVTAAFAAALAGGCIGFLFFNHHPARMFMGDTGSLALGGAVATLALLTRTELILPVLGAVFVAETLSVILQVASFKLTGKRIFRMSPLHHHFELGGWPETTVVYTFWAASLISAFLGVLLAMPIRF